MSGVVGAGASGGGTLFRGSRESTTWGFNLLRGASLRSLPQTVQFFHTFSKVLGPRPIIEFSYGWFLEETRNTKGAFLKPSVSSAAQE